MNNDLISRSALLERLAFKRDHNRLYQKSTYPGLESAISQVKKAPAVDAVPVVRCKDCCHAVVVRNKGVVMYIGCGYFPNNILSKDFYCANGGAKMDGGNDG